MIGPAFFRSADVQQALRRASVCGSLPISVHFVGDAEEGPKLAGFGATAMCAYVTQLAAGRRACCASRAPASFSAVRAGRPTPFICHMGQACLTTPAFRDAQYALTFGLYYPPGVAETLESDARRGLEALGVRLGEKLPVTLSDISETSPDAVQALAEWTLETFEQLRESWSETSVSDASANADAEQPVQKKQHSRRYALTVDRAADIAAALAGGNQDQARNLVQGVMAEARGSSRTKATVRRARAVAVVAQTLEACEQARLSTARCWDRLPEFVQAAQLARTDAELSAAAMRVLGVLKPPHATRKPLDDNQIVEINRLVAARLEEGITLNEVAQRLGVHPTAVTHRLQRNFGVSYSEYVGRLRINKAKELLRRTKLGAGAIARRVGIGDTSNFSKLFRKYEGVSPSEYRSRFRCTENKQ